MRQPRKGQRYRDCTDKENSSCTCDKEIYCYCILFYFFLYFEKRTLIVVTWMHRFTSKTQVGVTLVYLESLAYAYRFYCSKQTYSCIWMPKIQSIPWRWCPRTDSSFSLLTLCGWSLLQEFSKLNLLNSDKTVHNSNNATLLPWPFQHVRFTLKWGAEQLCSN